MYIPERKGESVIARIEGRWTPGRVMEEPDPWEDESFYISFEDNPFVDRDSARLHKEDILENTEENQEKYISPQDPP